MTRERKNSPDGTVGDSTSKSPSTTTTDVPSKDDAGGGEGGNKAQQSEQSPPQASSDRKNKDKDTGDETDTDDKVSEEAQTATTSRKKLYKSPRFKGYLTLFLSSIVNFQAVSVSQRDTDLNTVPASTAQANYGSAVALISCILTGASILLHIDRCTCFKKIWEDKIFASKSRYETLLDVFLVIWWGVATIIQTSVRGIAGDGKNQYNIFYSTWVCFWATCWTLESKLTEYGWPTLKQFVKSWPHRAPGWIGIFVTDFFTLFWYVDLYVNTAVNPSRLSTSQQLFYGDIPKSQYQWLIFVASVTLVPSAGFVFIEIFRNSDSTEKSTSELVLEGVSLLCLLLAWVPCVIVATAPGGFASILGNAYIFSWMLGLFVIETSMWFVRDSRESVHHTLEQKEEEYKAYQQKVLEKSHQLQEDVARQNEELQRQRSQSRDWTPTMFRRNTLSLGSADSAGREQQQQQQQSQQEDRKPPSLRTGESDDQNNKSNINDNRRTDDGGTDSPVGRSNKVHETDTDAPHHHFQMNDMGDDEDNDENVDDEIRQERMLREADRSAYFDTLADDIL